jgi:hypothetical protein
MSAFLFPLERDSDVDVTFSRPGACTRVSVQAPRQQPNLYKFLVNPRPTYGSGNGRLLCKFFSDGNHAFLALAGVEYNSAKTEHESPPPSTQPFFFERYPIIDRKTATKSQQAALPPGSPASAPPIPVRQPTAFGIAGNSLGSRPLRTPPPPPRCHYRPHFETVAGD